MADVAWERTYVSVSLDLWEIGARRKSVRQNVRTEDTVTRTGVNVHTDLQGNIVRKGE